MKIDLLDARPMDPGRQVSMRSCQPLPKCALAADGGPSARGFSRNGKLAGDELIERHRTWNFTTDQKAVSHDSAAARHADGCHVERGQPQPRNLAGCAPFQFGLARTHEVLQKRTRPGDAKMLDIEVAARQREAADRAMRSV